MLQTYKTYLSKKLQLTSDVWLYTFTLNEPKEILFVPGQYLIMFIPQDASSVIPAKAGIQTSGSQIESEMTYARRLYSIASPNTATNEFELLVKLIPSGCASRYLEKLEVGSEASFQGPAGMFTLRESPRDKIFMVTGTGYAPVRSMLLSLSMKEAGTWKMGIETGQEDRKKKIDQTPTSINQFPNPLQYLNPSSTFYLFFGFSYYKDVFLLEELKRLTIESSNNPTLNFDFKICLSREQNLDMIPEEDKKYFLLGRVTKGLETLMVEDRNWKLDKEVRSLKLENQTSNLQPQDPASSIQPQSSTFTLSNYDFYLCSGRDIVESLKEYLYQKGVPKEQVYFEKF